MLNAQSLPGDLYDGHTLRDASRGVQRLTAIQIGRAYLDEGYRGHDAPNRRHVFISGQKHGMFCITKRELRGRSAIEPLVGHMKEGSHLGRRFLKCHAGDARQRHSDRRRLQLPPHLAWLREFLRSIFHALLAVLIGQLILNPALASD